MTTVVNCGLSLQITRQPTQRGISHFTPLPMGEGAGEGLSFFLQQALSKYRILYILLMLKNETGNDGTEQGC